MANGGGEEGVDVRSLAAYSVPVLQAGVVLILAYGVYVWNTAIIVNAALGLGATFLPALLKRDLDLRLSPPLVFFIVLSILLHTLGMVGLYQQTEWWDHLTHLLSAMVVASVAYATVVALDIHREDLYLPPSFLAVFLLTTALAFGVLWEVLEFGARSLGKLAGVKPVLVVFGVSDVTLDLVYDALGAVVVATVGTYRLRDDVRNVSRWLQRRQD